MPFLPFNPTPPIFPLRNQSHFPSGILKRDMGDYRAVSWVLLVFVSVTCISGEDPYRFFTWNVTYGDIYPLGVKQQVLLCYSSSLFSALWFLCFLAFLYFLYKNKLMGFKFLFQGILINGQFPGPPIESVTNDNLIVSVYNSLDEPFLLSWSVPFSFPIFLYFLGDYFFVSSSIFPLILD